MRTRSCASLAELFLLPVYISLETNVATTKKKSNYPISRRETSLSPWCITVIRVHQSSLLRLKPRMMMHHPKTHWQEMQKHFRYKAFKQILHKPAWLTETYEQHTVNSVCCSSRAVSAQVSPLQACSSVLTLFCCTNTLSDLQNEASTSGRSLHTNVLTFSKPTDQTNPTPVPDPLWHLPATWSVNRDGKRDRACGE